MNLQIRIRVGASLFLNERRFCRWRGDTAFGDDPKVNALECFDYFTQEWTEHETSGDHPVSVTGAGVAVIRNKLYLFGGFASLSSEAEYFRDLYELDLLSYAWKKIIPINNNESPIRKYIFGMAALDLSSLLIFGGFGLKSKDMILQPWSQYHWSDEFKAMWTNEVHIYDIVRNQWIGQETKGIKPSPCAAFCFTRIDQSRFIMFGGRHHMSRVNEIHILDSTNWEWSGPILPLNDQQWPCERSLHTGVCLLDPMSLPSPTTCSSSNLDDLYGNQFQQRLLVIWGQDKDSDPINDTWILNVKSLKWERLKSDLLGRKWHSTAVLYTSPFEAVVVTIGGFGKNQQSWTSPNHRDTVIMKFGVPCLYNLCIQNLCQMYSSSPAVLSKVFDYLPKHIAEHIQNFISGRETCVSMFESYSCIDYTPKVYQM